MGAFLAGKPAGNVLLNLGGPQIAFGLVGGGWDLQVAGEAQDVGFAVAEDLDAYPANDAPTPTTPSTAKSRIQSVFSVALVGGTG